MLNAIVIEAAPPQQFDMAGALGCTNNVISFLNRLVLGLQYFLNSDMSACNDFFSECLTPPTFAHQKTLDHILCILGYHEYRGGRSPCQSLAEILLPPLKRQSEEYCKGISDGRPALLWTQTAGRSLHTDTGVPLKGKWVSVTPSGVICPRLLGTTCIKIRQPALKINKLLTVNIWSHCVM